MKANLLEKMIKPIVAVVGLGYVGLPLAVEFGKKYETIGFDHSETKVDSCREFCDLTGELSSSVLRTAVNLSYTTDPADINNADVIIITVPTPVNEAHIPDLSPLIGASITVGKYLKKGAIVVFESTVYPGATEEVCIPLLEKHSAMSWKQDFNVGYSPERVNPGDKLRTITKIKKVVSGDVENTLSILTDLYASVITAGVYQASSIKVAEAAKVIENTQRDLNIALINELAMIFEKIDVDTLEVLEAAGSKWNFLPFRPGLVGGHCIGVDPYYLTYKAEMLGYHPQVILAGRRINDGMPNYITQRVIKQMIHGGSNIRGAQIVVLGLTFKENCADLRNSKVGALVKEFREFGCQVTVHDPLADAAGAEHEYGIILTPWEMLPNNADVIIAAVSHKEYFIMPLDDILEKLKKGGIFADLKSAFSSDSIRSAGYNLWRL